MFVITLSNMFVTHTGLADGGGIREWETLEEAKEAAIALNAIHGLHAYIHPADRTDRTLEMIDTYTFGYAN